jgi:hypothetical protein
MVLRLAGLMVLNWEFLNSVAKRTLPPLLTVDYG